jgi:glycosyltransferase involved in cell wall biosynthesis
VYAAVDVVVNPARVSEAFGRVAVEALAAGRPVVATRVGAVAEVLRPGEDALIVEPDDPHAIAAAVVRLWRDPELRHRLVASGYERVRERFREDDAARAFVAVVKEVLVPAAPRLGHGE